MNYIELLLRMSQGKVLTIKKNPWLKNIEYQDKINWLIEQGYIEKVLEKGSSETKYLVVTETGLAFLKNQNSKSDDL